MKRLKKPSGNLMLSLYLKLLPAQILAAATTCVCMMLNSLIISNALGEEALATLNLVSSVTNIVFIVSLVLSGGTIFYMTRAICEGKKEDVERVFSSVFALTVIIGGVIFAVSMLFPTQICTALGASEEILDSCREYLRGIAIGYFAMLLNSVYIEVFEISASIVLPVFSSATVFIVNIGLTSLFAYGYGLDIKYFGLAVSVSQIIGLSVLFFSNLKKKLISISLKKISFSLFGGLLVVGLTQSAGVIFGMVRDIFINIFRAEYGGVKALAAFGVIGGADSLTGTLIVPPFLLVTLMIASVYINSQDRESLRRLTKLAFLIGFIISIAVFLITVGFSEPLARLYGVEDIEYTVYAQKLFSLAYLFYVPNVLLVKLYASLEKTKVVNILSFIGYFALPLFATAIFTLTMGINGLWISISVGELIALVTAIIYSVIHNRRFPRSIDELLCLDDDFGVGREDTYSVSVKNVNDAVEISDEIIGFCRKKEISQRISNLCGVCLEEITANIVTHGFRHKEKKGLVNVSVIVKNKTVTIIIRDNCPPFDPYQKLSCDNPEHCLGIRTVMAAADTIEHKCVYGMNILTVSLTDR